VKVAVSAEGPGLDTRAGGRFGISAYFIIVDKQTMTFEAIQNPGGAGQGAAGWIPTPANLFPCRYGLAKP